MELLGNLTYVTVRSATANLFSLPLALDTLAVLGLPLTILVGLSVELKLFYFDERGLASRR